MNEFHSPSQKERVKQKIKEDGYADNFWAIENYILRLGAVIYSLSKEGMVFKRAFGKELGKERKYWKNFYYIHAEEPKQETLL